MSGAWILGQLYLALAGLGLVRLALHRAPLPEIGLLATTGLSLLAGPALLGVVVSFLGVVGLPLSMPVLIGVLAPAAAYGAWPRRWRHEPSRFLRGGTPRGGLPDLVTALLALLPAVLVGRVGFDAAVVSDDEFTTWLLKGRVLSLTERLDERFFLSDLYFVPDYPLLVPSLVRWSDGLIGTTTEIGRAQDAYVHLPVALLLAGGLLTLGWLVRVMAGPLAAWVAVLLVAALPGVVGRLGVLVVADVPVLVFGLTATLSLMLWVQRPEHRWLALAAVLGSGAIATKSEGLLFVGAALLSVLVVRPRRWRSLLVCGAIIGLASLPWRAWVLLHDLPSPFAAEGTLSLTAFQERWRYSEVVFGAFSGYVDDLAGPIALVAVVAVAVACTRRAVRLATALSLQVTLLLGVLWLQYLVYPVAPRDELQTASRLVRHIDSTAPRVLLLPVALILVALPLLTLARAERPERWLARRRRVSTGRDWRHQS